MFGHRYFGARQFGPRYFGDGGGGAPPVVVATTMYWGLLGKKKREPDEALKVIEIYGSEAEQQRAAAIEASALLARLTREKRLLSEEQIARAHAEKRWAMAVATRIAREREEEDIALALLMD